VRTKGRRKEGGKENLKNENKYKSRIRKEIM
jgi:hypothetical protein